MFTGIIEDLGEITAIEKDKNNVHFTLKSAFTHELKIDQSLAHNGICLTVININENEYTVTAIKETLNKTNLDTYKVGDKINLERCMQIGARLDGHIVQGHVDNTGVCSAIVEENGSWKFTFTYSGNDVTVEKGSVTLNGVSLTVVDSKENNFSVCIIPYTFEHTNFHQLKIGDKVNIEFDIIGKYVSKLMTKSA